MDHQLAVATLGHCESYGRWIPHLATAPTRGCRLQRCDVLWGPGTCAKESKTLFSHEPAKFLSLKYVTSIIF